MKAAGIVQDGDPVLRQQAVPFRLPEEAAEAEAVIAALFAALQRAGEQHVFSKGMGMAAPQIGTPRAAAIVIPPDPGAEPAVMLTRRAVHTRARQRHREAVRARDRPPRRAALCQSHARA